MLGFLGPLDGATAVIRDCMPTDHPLYSDLHLADHLALVGINQHCIQEARSKKELFELFEDEFIKGRSIWMQSFRKGLFVESKLHLVVDLCLSFHL
jgi:hypothetical protein